eukprot:TRINITY_DN250_c0_g1_i1.p1 TRINITY_DN250_c0_g1~~TRINITY_DN250_c0_g1_i1.p1  ORF type:complete len:334 (+),score=106.73 TRINITY_DN250_c0_g1_i1:88-1089(+)
MAEKSPVRVAITGAAGQIGYSLTFAIARGEMLGPDQPVILHLLDIEPMMGVLGGVVMEIEDCALPLVKGVVATADLKEAFDKVNYVLMVGAMPRKEGMERKDLLKANCGIFKVQGKALSDHADKNVRVVVVGNPANTNALICLSSASGLDRRNFSALTRLDHNRAQGLLARRLGANVNSIKNIIIWGNHSKTQYPDINHGVLLKDGNKVPLKDAVNDDAWRENEFVSTIQTRGAAVIAARKASSAASAAKAIVDHMRDWALGTAEGEWVSMGVASDGSYGIKEGLIYSYPVTTKNGEFTIVQGLNVDEFSRKKMDETAAELEEERQEALSFLG